MSKFNIGDKVRILVKEGSELKVKYTNGKVFLNFPNFSNKDEVDDEKDYHFGIVTGIDETTLGSTYYELKLINNLAIAFWPESVLILEKNDNMNN